METVIILVTVCIAFTSLVWFIWDGRKEFLEISERHEDTLTKIEKAQKEGFKALEEGQKKLAKILYKLDVEEREGLKTLAEISKKTDEGKAH